MRTVKGRFIADRLFIEDDDVGGEAFADLAELAAKVNSRAGSRRRTTGHFRPVGATAQFPSERPFIKSINGQPYSGAKGEPLREVAQI